MTRSPFGDLDQVLNQLGGELPVPLGGVAVDLLDRGDDYLVRANVPGVEREDIELTLRDGQLTITVDWEAATTTEEGEYVTRERRHTSHSRTISLPEGVDAADASATLTDGVLEVTLPKQHGGDGHRIDVE